jgi:GT2 family glycosyltransferase
VDSLKNIIENTHAFASCIYIDGNSPREVSAQLADICQAHGYTYVREERYLTPNQARNIALGLVDTRYVVFVDNDIFVEPGWLHHLVDCADQTGAWAVGPVIMEGSENLSVVHMAGGKLVEDEVGGFTRVRQQHRHMFSTLPDVRDQLVREPVGSFEFHCVLVRTDVFAERQFLDEGFLSHQEHLDLAREIRRAGGEVYFEPLSIVRYDTARNFEDWDREYFELRWSEEWSNESIEHCREKWGLGPEDRGLKRLAIWTARHRDLFDRSQTPWSFHILPIIARKKLATWLRGHNIISKREIH